MRKFLFFGWIVCSVLQSFAIDIGGNPLFYYFVFQILLLSAGMFSAGASIDERQKRTVRLMFFFYVWCVFGAVVLSRVFTGMPAFIPRLSVDEQVLNMQSVSFSQTNLTAIAYLGVNIILFGFAIRGKLGNLTSTFRAAAGPAAILIAVSMFLDWTNSSIWTEVLAPLLRNNQQGIVFDDLAFGNIRRLSGVFSEPSYAGIFSAAFSNYFLATFLEERKRKHLLLALVMAVCTIETTSFIGFVGLATGILIVTLLYGGFRKILPLIIVVGLGVVVFLTIGGGFDFVSTVYLDKFDSLSAFNRFASDLRSFEMLGESHYLGVGLGSHRASSLLSTLLATTGLLGTVLYFWISARVLRDEKSVKSRHIYRPIRVYCLIVLILLLLGNAEIASPIYWIGIIALVSAKVRENSKQGRAVEVAAG